MIYRDDDINRFVDMQAFLNIHVLFLKYNKVHTCVLEMKDLWGSRGIWHLLMTLPNISIGLHCWSHIDYSVLTREQARAEIRRALDYYEEKCIAGYGRVKPISTFYPPWNRVSPALKQACEDVGLNVDNRVDGEVFNFHWWEYLNAEALGRLEERLKI
jgi:hypothetical protein